MTENFLTKTIAKMQADREEFFWDACVTLHLNQISGDYAEFGSWGAMSLSAAYKALSAMESDRHLWAFDSFQGLPEVTDDRDARWQVAGKGPWGSVTGQGGVENFHADCERLGIPREAYTAVEGYFDETLTALGADGPPTDLALVYVDCNMYSSTVTVFDFLEPRLKHGMIVAFDDYNLWTDSQVSGERSALDEFLVRNPQWHFHRYKEVHYAGVSFVVEHADLVTVK